MLLLHYSTVLLLLLCCVERVCTTTTHHHHHHTSTPHTTRRRRGCCCCAHEHTHASLVSSLYSTLSAFQNPFHSKTNECHNDLLELFCSRSIMMAHHNSFGEATGKKHFLLDAGALSSILSGNLKPKKVLDTILTFLKYY